VKTFERKPHALIVTDFVACVGCRAMFYAPIPRPDPMPLRPGNNMEPMAARPMLDTTVMPRSSGTPQQQPRTT
jgi:hypothetical protein